MADTDSAVEGASDLMQIALNTLYLCLENAVRHIEEAESPTEASEFKSGLLEQVKDGRINAALLEDSALYEFVVPKIERLLSR